jgi:hypothetical protein
MLIRKMRRRRHRGKSQVTSHAVICDVTNHQRLRMVSLAYLIYVDLTIDTYCISRFFNLGPFHIRMHGATLHDSLSQIRSYTLSACIISQILI